MMTTTRTVVPFAPQSQIAAISTMRSNRSLCHVELLNEQLAQWEAITHAVMSNCSMSNKHIEKRSLMLSCSNEQLAQSLMLSCLNEQLALSLMVPCLHFFSPTEIWSRTKSRLWTNCTIPSFCIYTTHLKRWANIETLHCPLCSFIPNAENEKKVQQSTDYTIYRGRK